MMRMTIRPRMSERVMSGKLAILPSEVEPLTYAFGTFFCQSEGLPDPVITPFRCSAKCRSQV